ncbi:unnamed protein product [Lota lota]
MCVSILSVVCVSCVSELVLQLFPGVPLIHPHTPPLPLSSLFSVPPLYLELLHVIVFRDTPSPPPPPLHRSIAQPNSLSINLSSNLSIYRLYLSPSMTPFA